MTTKLRNFKIYDLLSDLTIENIKKQMLEINNKNNNNEFAASKIRKTKQNDVTFLSFSNCLYFEDKNSIYCIIKEATKECNIIIHNKNTQSCYKYILIANYFAAEFPNFGFEQSDEQESPILLSDHIGNIEKEINYKPTQITFCEHSWFRKIAYNKNDISIDFNSTHYYRDITFDKHTYQIKQSNFTAESIEYLERYLSKESFSNLKKNSFNHDAVFYALNEITETELLTTDKSKFIIEPVTNYFNKAICFIDNALKYKNPEKVKQQLNIIHNSIKDVDFDVDYTNCKKEMQQMLKHFKVIENLITRKNDGSINKFEHK